MQRLRRNQKSKPLSEVRAGIASYIQQVHDTKRPLIITQDGKGIAVLLSVNEYESMQAKMDLMTDIQTSINQIENGDGIEHGEAKAMVTQRIVL
ncbi:MAG: prevent-host-death family protein [Deltaproteobacteria bacterium]|nr:MAG: prevent-host-death family protein [Deltaproteobacteria bacterium]